VALGPPLTLDEQRYLRSQQTGTIGAFDATALLPNKAPNVYLTPFPATVIVPRANDCVTPRCQTPHAIASIHVRQSCPSSPARHPCRSLGSRIVSALGRGVKTVPSAQAPAHVATPAERELESYNARDPQVAQLAASIRQLNQKMMSEKQWVAKVQALVRHFQSKIITVSSDISSQRNTATSLKRALTARLKANAHRLLSQKLSVVDQKLRHVDAETAQWTGKVQSINAMKQRLAATVRQINSRIRAVASEPVNSPVLALP